VDGFVITTTVHEQAYSNRACNIFNFAGLGIPFFSILSNSFITNNMHKAEKSKLNQRIMTRNHIKKKT
jgi:hypothetical protein